ncbi:MAG: T9SS type A sorting domain-containing protein [Lewinellaceae bacterium]|nr:T9SS type A sorting domain-containing protein [Lewinellaceae bacterium]
MKQPLLRYCFFLLLGVTMSGQATFAIEPLTVSKVAHPDSTDVENHVEVINLTTNSLSINWERVIIDIGQGCQTQVCDPFACFADFISTHTFNLPGSDTADLIVHLINHTGSPCCAIVHLKVKDVADPSNIITAVYLFNDCAGSSAKDQFPAANVKLLANPVAEYFELQNDVDVAQIRLYDIQGRLVEYLKGGAGQRYNVSDLTPGTYILALEEKNGNVFQAIEMVKK